MDLILAYEQIIITRDDYLEERFQVYDRDAGEVYDDEPEWRISVTLRFGARRERDERPEWTQRGWWLNSTPPRDEE